MKVFMLLLVIMTHLPLFVKATSFKMDFLSSGTVRTDPLMFSQIGNCLSDHVHRFYGATSPLTMRPDVSFQDLRSASGNTGNVEENKSLYWNPAIYQVKNPNGDKTFEIVDVWFASAYYVFRTGQTKTFPSGLKMKAFGDQKLSRTRAVCDGPYACERDDSGGCNGYGPSNQTQHGFLPVQGCSELEMNIKFPTCWDGVNTESLNGNHMVYSEDCDGDEHNECFDFDCPASHPVKLPEIHLYVRVLGYEGGAHMFADGTDIFHSDYFSGWDETELQNVLDNCDNYSEAAMPDAFCSNWLTFRGKEKVEGVQVDDSEIRSDLEEIQPDPIDIKGTISPEEVTNVSEIPRGSCTGTLIPAGTLTSTTTSPTTASPTTTSPTTTSPTTTSPTTTSPTTTSPTTTTTTESAECSDIWSQKKCKKRKNQGKCFKAHIANMCQKTCCVCGDCELPCIDYKPTSWCENKKNKGKCNKNWIKGKCPLTCGVCTP